MAAFLVLLALYLRTSGLFRGLGAHGYIFHPDEAKQVQALFNFLNGDYVRYYGSLFYDGYPYGLNHLDEYILRPLLLFFWPTPPDQHALYPYARLLRVAYGMLTIFISYKLVYRLTEKKSAALLAMLLLAIAPISITVTHFATGDIGVDIFTALCFLCLLFYLEDRYKKTWLVGSGVAVGAAFSAKYNGFFVGMVPAMILCLEFRQDKKIRLFAKNCFILIVGTFLGIILFTPNFLLDFSPTLDNILANFTFIKNYNVPAEILAKPWLEKALLGLKANSIYIITSLGYTLCLSSLLSLLLTGKKYLSEFNSVKKRPHAHTLFLLSLGLFPILSLFLALSGKYVVQPFHFSYLLLPLVIMACVLFSTLYSSKNIFLKTCGLLLVGSTIIEFGLVSWQDNFFWRIEDNVYIEQNLPASIYNREAFYTHRSGPIRSLFVEPSAHSVFRNHKLQAKGPDSHLWNTIKVAPLPQVANPIGNTWIFLNGPSFPRNERMLAIRGGNYGKTINRYLVLPAKQNFPTFGLRCGSYATKAVINFGQASTTVQLDAHQQKTIFLEPKKWRVSKGQSSTEEGVYIIPLEISVPHNDVWLTILTSDKERELFNLFGGGQKNSPSIPEKIPTGLEQEYFSALSRIRYLELLPSWRVAAGKSIPMWEVALPAGRYKLICEIDGLADESEITIELEDARGGLYRGLKQSFQIKSGIQRIEYTFTKPFVPYQSRFVINGVTGTCQMLSFKLFPDYQKLFDDFNGWRTSGIKPDWVSRFAQ